MASGSRESNEAPTVVCVIGTPRSGTSLTARILNLAGVYLGPEDEMVPAGKWNPAGFWENRHIVALNRRLLAALEREGEASPGPVRSWAASEALAGEREEARKLLAETFRDRPLWGWKDAGSTLILPFWQQLQPTMRYVICLRNPIDIIASADRVQRMTRSQALATWTRYVAAALAYTSGQHRMLVFYEDYLDPNARHMAIERLWRFIGHDTCLSDATAERLEAPIDESLLHHRTPAARTLQDDSLPLATSSMYLIAELLRRAVPGAGDAPPGATALREAVDAHSSQVVDGFGP